MSGKARIQLVPSRHLARLCVPALLCSGLVATSSAQATTTTVGQLFTPTALCSGSDTNLQTGVATGANSYTIPSDGVITSWSFQNGATAPTGLKLKVARPAGGGSFTITGEAAAGTQVANTASTFQTQIPVTAGDVIGIHTDNGDCDTGSSNGSYTVASSPGDVPLGTTSTFGTASGELIPISAQLAPRPGISLISPTSGSISGGTSVTIAGHDFSGTAVSFGNVAAKSFTVDSDSQITAISPPASAPGPVDVRVTTAGGATLVVAADNFTYTACVVPNLNGKKLKNAKSLLARADCRLGKVTGHKTKKSKAKKQSAKPGTALPPGSTVNLKVG